MQVTTFDEVVDKILLRDVRFHRDAYHFVREALDHTQKAIHKNIRESKPKKERHVSGQQLLEGIRGFALRQDGPMTITLFEEWGVRCCEDFGEIVFNLVDHGNGLFGKTDQDSREDFKGGYNFIEAFRQPFLPSQTNSGVVPRTKPSPIVGSKPT